MVLLVGELLSGATVPKVVTALRLTEPVVIGIDPYHDKRIGYYFGLSAAGTIYDGVFFNDSWQDNSWDGVWEGVVQRNQDGWSLEMRIPFSQLRFKKSDTYIWGVNLYRKIQRKNEENLPVITPRNESGIVSRFADMIGIANIDASRKVEILPYFRSKAEYRAVESGDPFNDGSRYFMGTDVFSEIIRLSHIKYGG